MSSNLTAVSMFTAFGRIANTIFCHLLLQFNANEAMMSIHSNGKHAEPSALEMDQQQESFPHCTTSVQVSGKRNRENSTSPASKRKKINDDVDKDESSTCPICFDNWSIYGEHRLCALRCGHMFGYKCVKRLLCSKIIKCPMCNAKNNLQDIRFLYAKKIKVTDNRELVMLKKKLSISQAKMLQLRIKFERFQEAIDNQKKKLAVKSKKLNKLKSSKRYN